MSELDNIVRATLRERSEQPPPMMDTADRVIRAAVKTRRRRIGVAAVAVLTLAAGGLATVSVDLPGVRSLPWASQPVATPWPAAAAAVRVDLLVGDSGVPNVFTADGRTVPLGPVGGAIGNVYAVAGGWLVESRDADLVLSVWLVTLTDPPVRLLDNIEGLTLTSDGGGFAWRGGDQLHTGHLSGLALDVDASSPAPDRGQPIAYTGTTVVLGYSATGGGIDHFDTWLPARGDYVASWERTAHVVTVYPVAADGSLLGLVRGPAGGKETCLARLDAAGNLRPTQTACRLPLTIDPLGLVSPDGRWLAAPVIDGSGLRVALIDLTRIFDEPAITTTWDAERPASWLDATTLLVVKNARTVLLAKVGQESLVSVTAPGVPAGMARQPIRQFGQR